MASIKDLKRMCKTYKHCGDGCPFCGSMSCTPNELSDDADEIVGKLVAKHPAKTYAMDFFEKFPNARKDPIDEPTVCVADMYGVDFDCHDGCHACWNEVLPDEQR